MRKLIFVVCGIWSMAVGLVSGQGGQINVIMWESNAVINVPAGVPLLVSENRGGSRRSLELMSVTNGVRFIFLNAAPLTNSYRLSYDSSGRLVSNLVVGTTGQTNAFAGSEIGRVMGVGGQVLGYYFDGGGCPQGQLVVMGTNLVAATIRVTEGLSVRP